MEFQIHYLIAQIAEEFKLTKINTCQMCNVQYSKLHPQNMWTDRNTLGNGTTRMNSEHSSLIEHHVAHKVC